MKRQSAFTLVELLVVIAIIGVLAALLLPAVQMVRESGRRAICIKNLQSVAQAEKGYESAKEFMSPLRKQYTSTSGMTTTQIYTGWVHELLPYMDAINLHQQIQTAIRSGNDPSSYNPEMKILACPSDSSANSADVGKLSYAANGGRANVYTGGATDVPANGVFQDQITSIGSTNFTPKKIFLSDVNDGTSNTILFAETLDADVWNLLAGVGFDTAAATANEFRNCVIWESLTLTNGPLTNPATVPTFDMSSVGRSPLIAHPDAGRNPVNGSGGATFAHPSSKHPGVFVVAMCDGSTKTITTKVDYGVYCLLMSSNGRKVNDPGSSGNPPVPAWQSTQLIGEDSY